MSRRTVLVLASKVTDLDSVLRSFHSSNCVQTGPLNAVDDPPLCTYDASDRSSVRPFLSSTCPRSVTGCLFDVEVSSNNRCSIQKMLVSATAEGAKYWLSSTEEIRNRVLRMTR